MNQSPTYVMGILLACVLLGCSNQEPAKGKTQNKEEKIEQALAKLSPDDRKIADEQKFCVVQNKSRLGSMGTPVKLMLNEEPVFLCCAECEKEATKDKEATVKKAKKLREGPR